MESYEYDNSEIIADELAYLSGQNVPAGHFRRIIAFLMDTIVAFVPALVFLLIFSTSIAKAAPALYACPIIGSLSLTNIPEDVNNYMNNMVDASDDTTADDLKDENTRGVRNVSFMATACRILSVFVILFYIGYSACCTYLFDGVTVGKHFMHLKVTTEKDEDNLTKAIIFREVIGKILINSIPIVPIISVFTILFTPSHKAVHDYIGKTKLIEC